MNITIRATNYQLSDHIRAYTEQKIGALAKLLRRKETLCAVELAHDEKHQRGNVYVAEANVDTGEKLYRATARGETMHAAIDILESELMSEVSREKKKSRGIMRRTGAAMKSFFNRG